MESVGRHRLPRSTAINAASTSASAADKRNAQHVVKIVDGDEAVLIAAVQQIPLRIKGHRCDGGDAIRLGRVRPQRQTRKRAVGGALVEDSDVALVVGRDEGLLPREHAEARHFARKGLWEVRRARRAPAARREAAELVGSDRARCIPNHKRRRFRVVGDGAGVLNVRKREGVAQLASGQHRAVVGERDDSV